MIQALILSLALAGADPKPIEADISQIDKDTVISWTHLLMPNGQILFTITIKTPNRVAVLPKLFSPGENFVKPEIIPKNEVPQVIPQARPQVIPKEEIPETLQSPQVEKTSNRRVQSSRILNLNDT